MQSRICFMECLKDESLADVLRGRHGYKYYYFISLASLYHGKSSSSPPDLTNNSIMVGLCNIFKAEFAKNVPVETEISNIHLGRRQRLNPVLVVGSPVGQPLHSCAGLLKSRASHKGATLFTHQTRLPFRFSLCPQNRVLNSFAKRLRS